MAWDPKTYLSFGTERTRPAIELLARVADEAPACVADLGCGPGNSTAVLRARWPQAHIEGVDSSAEMLDRARESGVHAHWVLADIGAWSPDRAFDVVFSNATYQWLADHGILLPRLFDFVAPGGAFAFQVPDNFNEPSHRLMREVAANGSWAETLRDVRGVYVELPQTYFDLFVPHAQQIDIWQTRYLQVLEGDDAVYRWVGATGLRAFSDVLGGREQEEFLAEYRARLRVAYPKREDGKTLFPFPRLFAVIRKP